MHGQISEPPAENSSLAWRVYLLGAASEIPFVMGDAPLRTLSACGSRENILDTGRNPPVNTKKHPDKKTWLDI
jgi:hypothetical protein